MNQRFMTGLIFAVGMTAAFLPAFALPLWTIAVTIAVAGLLTWELHQSLVRIFKPLSFGVMTASSMVFISPMLIYLIYRAKLVNWRFLLGKGIENISIDSWRLDYSFLLASSFAVIISYLFILTAVVIIYTVLSHGAARIPQAVTALSTGFYVGIPLACVPIFLYFVPNGFFWLILAIIIPQISDVCAYYVGSRFGKHPFFNYLSPKKSLEGALAGILGSVIFSAIYFMIFMSGKEEPLKNLPLALLFGFVSGAVLSIFAQLGDLFASGLKRWTGIKDFSNILPAHGGLLDRFDSILFSLATSMILSTIYLFT